MIDKEWLGKAGLAGVNRGGMLFQKHFHEGIRKGRITLTFRAWKSARVRIGGHYRLGAVGMLVVDALDWIPISAITKEEARHAGFQDVRSLVTQLERMDARRPGRPWTFQVLDLIQSFPCTAASRLAPMLGREPREFKADVRKLKRLGLTISHRVGYELSGLGLQLWRIHHAAKSGNPVDTRLVPRRGS